MPGSALTFYPVQRMNFYLILGVARDANAVTIRRAFRALVRRYHPDAGTGSSSDKFRQIVAAYETLSDPVRRQRYDRTLQEAPRSRAETVEPFARSGVVVEPLRGGRRAPLDASHRAAVQRVDVDELIEDFFRTWEDVLFHVGRRRGW